MTATFTNALTRADAALVARFATQLDCTVADVLHVALLELGAVLHRLRREATVRYRVVSLDDVKTRTTPDEGIDEIVDAFRRHDSGSGTCPPPIAVGPRGHVGDGNHRVTAARRMGRAAIDAYVFSDPVDIPHTAPAPAPAIAAPTVLTTMALVLDDYARWVRESQRRERESAPRTIALDALDDIVTVRPSASKLASLVETFRAGDDIPPIRLIWRRQTVRELRLSSGNHRLAAARLAGVATIKCSFVRRSWDCPPGRAST